MKKIITELLEKLQQGELCTPNCYGCCGDGKIDITCPTVVKKFVSELSKILNKETLQKLKDMDIDENSDFWWVATLLLIKGWEEVK